MGRFVIGGRGWGRMGGDSPPISCTARSPAACCWWTRRWGLGAGGTLSPENFLETSDAEGITTGWPVYALTVVRCRCLLDLPRLSHLPVCLHVCMRLAMCGSHASRNVWSAFTPACKPALAVALAPAPARPPRPRLGAGCPFCLRRLPIPGRPRACLPRLPDSDQPFPPVSPEWGGASRLPRPNNDGSSRPHSRPHRSPKLAPQPGFLPRRRRGRSLPSPCERLPSLGPRMSPQAPPTRSRSLVFLGFAQENVFF
jgi:hypothetical protein